MLSNEIYEIQKNRGYYMNFLFNEDNFLNKALNLCGDVIIANKLFVICSIPIITIGPSLTALYHCMLRSVKGNNNGTVKTFFRAFKENFKQSLAVWLGLLVIFAVLFLDIRFLGQTDSAFGKPFLIGSYSILLLVTVITLYIFPVIAAFQGTVKSHLRNALLFAFMHLPYTVAIVLINVFPLILVYMNYDIILVFLVCWTFFLFGLGAYLISKLFYRMFKPYLGEEDTTEDANFSIDIDKADGLIELMNSKNEK